MATRLKPTRINVDNTPEVGDGAAYQNDNDFHWSEGGGDMSYEDFEWVTLTGNSLVIENISNNVTPTGDFTVTAGTLRPGIEYVLRVNTGNTPYTMTLGTGVTNPNGYSTELAPNKVNQFKFIATSDSQLELEGVDTSDFVTLSTQQTITAKKTFDVEPELGTAKTTDATNNGTKFATEAQVYLKANANDVNTKTFYLSGTSDLTTAQAAVDWIKDSKNAIIYYTATNRNYILVSASPTKVVFNSVKTSQSNGSSYSSVNQSSITFNLSSGTVTSIDGTSPVISPNVLATDVDYGTPYTPQYNGSPATKKYVDDTASGKISDTAYGPGWGGQTTTAPSQNAVYDKISSIDALIPSEATSSNKLADKNYVDEHDTVVSSTAPSSPTEGMVWYDTTNDVLKIYDGTSWNTASSGGLTIMSYGNSTWNDFITAYNNNAIVYCKASSDSNPGTGTQSRMAFMVYVNNPTTPTEVEFQYYRSVATHSDSQQGDQVYVYKLNSTNGGTWSVTTREAYTKVVAGTSMTSSYSNGAITLNNDAPFSPGTGTTGDVLTKTANGYEWAAPTGGGSFTTTTVTLTTAGWSSKSQTVSATGVTASNTVIVSPTPASINDYALNSIYCSAQGSGTLTFTCNTVPSSAITVNVLILS